jgi:hypothetical protein
MQKEYPNPYISEHGFYTQTCSCGKNKHEDFRYCQECIDRKQFGQNFQNITTLESDIARIEQEQGDAEKQKLKLETQIEENTTKIQKIKDEISTLSSSLTNFKLKLTLEKLKIQLHSDVISDDRRIHEGTDDDGYVVLLETHCTIVRVFQSPENVYFGHVTLVITTKSREYKWHYGVEIYNKLPETLTHNFWKPADNTYSHKNHVNSFAYFDHIPEDITLEDMMLSHFNDCFEVFDKQQWSKQIWNDYTPIDEEDPNTLLQRLHQEHLKRNNLAFLTREQRRAEEKQKEEDIQRRQKQIAKTVKKRTSSLSEAIRLELSNTQPKIKKEQRQSRVRPVLTEEEIGKRTEQSQRDREMSKVQPSQQQPSQQQPRVVKGHPSQQQPSQQQPRVVKGQPSQQQPRVVKGQPSQQQPSQQQPRVVKGQPSQQQPRVVKKKDSEDSEEEDEEDEEDGITPNQFESQPQRPKLKTGEFKQIKRFEEIQDDLQKQITEYSELERELDKMIPISEKAIQLRDYLVREYDKYLKKINSYLTELSENKSRNIEVKLAKDSTIYDIGLIENLNIKDHVKNLRIKDEKIQLFLLRNTQKYVDLIDGVQKSLDDDPKEASTNRRYLIDEYRTFFIMYKDMIFYGKNPHISEEDKQKYYDQISDINQKLQPEYNLKLLVAKEKSYLIEYYRDKDIINEEDDIIIENLLIIQGLEYTKDKAKLYIDKIRNMKEKISGSRDLSTKVVLLIEYYRDKDISNEKDEIIIENILIIQGPEYTRDKAQLYINKSRDVKEKILGTRNLSTKDALTALKLL